MIKLYDPENFISEASTMSLRELINFLNSEVQLLDKIIIKNTCPHKQYQQEFSYYWNLLGGYLFFLKSGNKPASLKESDFQRTKPITESLVHKGQLNPSTLSAYD